MVHGIPTASPSAFGGGGTDAEEYSRANEAGVEAGMPCTFAQLPVVADVAPPPELLPSPERCPSVACIGEVTPDNCWTFSSNAENRDRRLVAPFTLKKCFCA